MAAILFNGGSSEKQLSPTEAAYLAGFFDGEGCFTIGRAHRKESVSGFAYEALMNASGTDLDTITALMVMCGNGKVQLQDKRSNPKHKTLYRVVFSPNQIRWLLPQIQPFLITKRKQAEILLRFLSVKRNGHNMTEGMWQDYENLRSEIRTLNRRGGTDTTAEELVVRDRLRRQPVNPPRACLIDGCESRHYQHGYCSAHFYEHVGRQRYTKRGPYERTCVTCQKPFLAYRSDTECCSVLCRRKEHYRKNSDRIKAQVAAAKERRKSPE